MYTGRKIVFLHSPHFVRLRQSAAFSLTVKCFLYPSDNLRPISDEFSVHIHVARVREPIFFRLNENAANTSQRRHNFVKIKSQCLLAKLIMKK